VSGASVEHWHEIGGYMAQRQLPPRYAVRYENTVLSKPAWPRVGDECAGGQAPDVVHECEATTLAGARSIERALQRRGHRLLGIYERLNLRFRPSVDEHSAEYPVLVCGKLDWEWDSERTTD
jgi:hypothetical protein